MKSLKNLWSKICKIDHIMVLFSIILLLVVIGCCTGCNAQNPTKDIPTMEYYDASGEHFDLESGIPFYAEGVIDFIYCTQDREYIIEYSDDDIFDYENLPKTLTCCPSDEDVKYITIFCSEEIFFDYLNWYSGITREDDEFRAASDKYVITEDWFEDSDSGYYYFRLVKK